MRDWTLYTHWAAAARPTSSASSLAAWSIVALIVLAQCLVESWPLLRLPASTLLPQSRQFRIGSSSPCWMFHRSLALKPTSVLHFALLLGRVW